MTPLMKRLQARIARYLTDSMYAASRADYIFGVRCKTKYDLQKDFIADIKTINSIAVMLGDMDVLAMCQMQAKQQKQSLVNDCDEILNDGGEA